MRNYRILPGVLALGLAACGGGGDAGGGDAGTVTIVSTNETIPGAAPVSAPAVTADSDAAQSEAAVTKRFLNASIHGFTPIGAATPSKGPRLPVGKCINMGNMLELPKEGEWGRAIADNDFRIIRDAGFNTVRIPVRWSAHAGQSAPYTIDPAFIGRVKYVVGLADAAGLHVILDMHAYDLLMYDPDAHAARFAAMWKQIGKAFASQGSNVWFELLNEPKGKISNANLLTILKPALANIRATNPTRPVIIGGAPGSEVVSLRTLEMPDDPYVVPTIHTYEPMEFTHQGADWVSPKLPLGRAYGTAADLTQLKGLVSEVRAYMDRTGRVPFVGEYGAIDENVPLYQRIQYYATVSAAFASIGVQSCAWSYDNTFRLRSGTEWLPGLASTIRTTTTVE